MNALIGPFIGMIVVEGVGLLLLLFDMIDCDRVSDSCFIKEGRKIQYIFKATFGVVFYIVGASCFCIKPSVDMLLLHSDDDLTNILNIFGISTYELPRIVHRLNLFFKIGGILFIVAGAVETISLIASSLRMKKHKFNKVCYFFRIV